MRASFLASAVCALAAGCASSPPSAPPVAALPSQSPSAARIDVPAIARPGGETADWWYRAGAAAVAARRAGLPHAHARNIILFVGDGMSLPTVAAARIYEGQRAGQPGEENSLAFEAFPWTGFSRTYNVDSQTPDSAGTMSAMATGAKTRKGVLSVGQTAPRGDCNAAAGAALPTVLELAEAAGLATGVVTTTRITHATPGGTYAHTPERNWEVDAALSPAAVAGGCHDIARQLIEFPVGDGIEVALGGGRSHFLPAGAADPEYPAAPGDRKDGRDLVREWSARHPDGRYVWSARQLAALDLAATPRLFGLFEPDHMQYEHDRANDRAGEPSLADMTRSAIGVLSRNPRGYFLLVEGGRIDHAHHAGNAFRALDETVALSDAVRAAATATSDADTLILVTADHAHTLAFVGYPRRGNPILGKVRGSSGEDGGGDFATDALGLPYTTLSYANGPGYPGASAQQPEGPKRFPHRLSGARPAAGRPNLRDVDTTDPDYLQESAQPNGSETHGGDDVGIWARGPGAQAVHGAFEQNAIFHLMVQAQPDIVRLLCGLGTCESGVPVHPADPAAVQRAATH